MVEKPARPMPAGWNSSSPSKKILSSILNSKYAFCMNSSTSARSIVGSKYTPSRCSTRQRGGLNCPELGRFVQSFVLFRPVMGSGLFKPTEKGVYVCASARAEPPYEEPVPERG